MESLHDPMSTNLYMEGLPLSIDEPVSCISRTEMVFNAITVMADLGGPRCPSPNRKQSVFPDAVK